MPVGRNSFREMEIRSEGFADLAAWIVEHLHVESAVLDGEIASIFVI